MAAQTFLAKLGIRLGTLGSAASLAFAAPLAEGDLSMAAHTDASRIGVYFDRAPSQERIGLVVLGVEGAAVTTTGINVRGVAYAWPVADAVGTLTSDGAGNLSWTPALTSIAWGDITGTLGDQTDLALALAGKETAGAAAVVQGNLDTHTGLTTTAHGGIVASTDPRLSDARTPTAHAASHAPGAADTVFPASAVGFLANDGAGNLSWSFAGAGTVTSVGLALPGIFNVTGSPVTGAGTLTGALADQNANLVWAGPVTGAAAAPTFRSLVAADIPALAYIGGTIAATQVAHGSGANTIQGSNLFVYDGSTLSLDLYNAVAATAPTLRLRHARGTDVAPTATQSGDTLGYFEGRGHGATAWATVGSSMRALANQTHTDTAWGSRLEFWTVADNATTATARTRVGNSSSGANGILQVSDNLATAMSLSASIQNHILNVFHTTGSNNDQCAIQGRSERSGNTGTRIGVLGRSYDTSAPGANAKGYGAQGISQAQSRGTALCQMVGTYGAAQIGTGGTGWGAGALDPQLITAANFFAGAAGVSVAAGTTNSVNVGIYGKADAAVANFGGYFVNGVRIVGLTQAYSTVVMPAGTLLGIIGEDGQAARWSIYGSADGPTSSPSMTAQRSRGTHAAPTAVQADDVLVSLGVGGYNGSAWTSTIASMRAYASGNWTGAAQGTYWEVTGVASGTTPARIIMRFECDAAVLSYPTITNRGKTALDLQVRETANDYVDTPISVGVGYSIQTRVATGDAGGSVTAVGNHLSVYGSSSATYFNVAVGSYITVPDNCPGAACFGAQIECVGIASANPRGVAIGTDLTLHFAVGGRNVVMGTAVGTADNSTTGMVIVGADRTLVGGNNGIALVRGGASTVNLQNGIMVGSATGQVGNFGKTYVIGVGFGLTVDASHGIAIGRSAAVASGHNYSVALGYLAATTAANQMMIGSATQALNVVCGFGYIQAATFFRDGVTNTAVSATITTGKTRFTGSTAGQTLTLPAGLLGAEHAVRNSASVPVTLDGNAAQTIEGAATFILYPGESVMLTWTGADWTVF